VVGAGGGGAVVPGGGVADVGAGAVVAGVMLGGAAPVVVGLELGAAALDGAGAAEVGAVAETDTDTEGSGVDGVPKATRGARVRVPARLAPGAVRSGNTTEAVGRPTSATTKPPRRASYAMARPVMVPSVVTAARIQAPSRTVARRRSSRRRARRGPDRAEVIGYSGLAAAGHIFRRTTHTRRAGPGRFQLDRVRGPVSGCSPCP